MLPWRAGEIVMHDTRRAETPLSSSLRSFATFWFCGRHAAVIDDSRSVGLVRHVRPVRQTWSPEFKIADSPFALFVPFVVSESPRRTTYCPSGKSAIYNAKPSNKPLVEHGVCDFEETADVGSDDQVA